MVKVKVKKETAMKKFLIFALSLASALLLSACEDANVKADNGYEIAITFIVVAVIVVVSHIILVSKTYICPGCGSEIKPKWYHFSVGIHFRSKNVVKCPKCGRKGFCEPKN